MALMQVTLIKKVALTHDIFELHYELPEDKEMIAGQFITFILPGIGGRAYSILELQGKNIILIIKRWPLEDGGRGGSIILCDAQIGETFKGVGPAGHFILTETSTPRCFIGTGTGLVPLYSHILEGLSQKTGDKYQLVFGVRYRKDMFYVQKFEILKKLYPDTFYYHLVLSRDPAEGMIHHGYVTDFLTEKSVKEFGEFYLCGAPGMIEGVQERLAQLGVKEEAIFFEKYS